MRVRIFFLIMTATSLGLSAQSPRVESLTLINADIGQAITGYSPIPAGAVINLSSFRSRHLNMLANVSAQVKSVEFQLDGEYRLDRKPYFSLCGDDDVSAYTSCSNLGIGSHYLTATPYAGENGSGPAGTPFVLSFQIEDSGGMGRRLGARRMYAVNQSGTIGSISVYDIDAGHQLIKTIGTVPNVSDIRGVVASAITSRLYVSYENRAGTGMIYCLDLKANQIVWNRAVFPGVDRLAITPDGRKLFVPSSEKLPNYNFINVLRPANGDLIRTVRISNRTHDAQYPLSGPIFQESKDRFDGRYLYEIDPGSFAVTRHGPFAGILGPFAVDSTSTIAVVNVIGLNGMQVINLRSGQIITANQPGPSGFPHGIGWTPDQSEVWESSATNPVVHVWDMTNPMFPSLKKNLSLSNGGTHWLTFSIKGDYAYIAPRKGNTKPTQVFRTSTHQAVGSIGSSEDMLEIDFSNTNTVLRVGDQYGIGRK